MPREPSKTIAQVEAAELPKEMPVKEPERKYSVGRHSHGLYFIAFTGGGTLPEALHGQFTSAARAQTQIDKYVANLPQRPDLASLFPNDSQTS
jgi:hypothetical protein